MVLLVGAYVKAKVIPACVVKTIRRKIPKLAGMNYIGFHYYDGSEYDEIVAWWSYGVWLWDSTWWVYGMTMTVEGDDTGYGSHISLGVVEGNEASCRTRHQSALLSAIHKNKWVISYVIHPLIITLSTNPYHVQLMRRGSAKAKDSLRCESHLQKPEQRRVYALGSVLMWPKLLASGLVL